MEIETPLAAQIARRAIVLELGGVKPALAPATLPMAPLERARPS
jgi:hypothetical protein